MTMIGQQWETATGRVKRFIVALDCGHLAVYIAPPPERDDIMFCQACDVYQAVLGFVQVRKNGQSKTVNLGPAVAASFFGWTGRPNLGLILWHATSGQVPCQASFLFDWGQRSHHRLWCVQWFVPLTVTPDLSCPHCGCSGRIHSGRWIPG